MDEFKARLAKLSPEKQKFLLKQLQNKNKDHFEERILPQKRNNSANSFTLSYPQQRLFVLEQFMPGNLAYNAPLLFRLNGKLNLTALKISLNEMARRHEILRTTFHVQDEIPIQIIAPSLNVDVPVVDLRHLPPVEQEAEIKRLFQQETHFPFDLSQLPLWRTKLIQINEEEYVLLLTIHHIIFDGWSVGVLIGEVGVLYEAAIAQKLASVPKLPIQYADYALWQKQKLQGEFLKSQLDYWKQQLAGISSLQLPTDRPFSPVQTTEGGAVLPLEFPETLSLALKQLSHREQTTLNMTTLAAFFALLGRYTQQDDVAVGSVIANRNHREVESLIGFFVNTLVLRSDLSDNLPFCELLKRVRKITLEGYEHREMPFDLLVEKLQPERDWSRNPLVQVGFAFQNAPTPVSQIGAITVHSIEVDLSHARFDLELHLWEGIKGLEGTLVYKTSLFDAATITRLAAHYQRLLEGIVSNPNTRIKDLPLLTDAEIDQMLIEGNSIHTTEGVQCLHHLFEAQVESHPNTIAVIFKDKKLTYRQLNEKSNQIAHYLKKQGVTPEAIVGLCMECSVEKIAAILGILKVGGTFVLLDPTYPQQQLASIVTDTQIAVLLTQQHLLKNLSQNQAQLFCLDSDWQTIEQHNKENLNYQITSSNLAYITYSSGHNLLVEHRNIISHLNWLQTTIALSESDVLLHKTTQAQDTAIWEIFLPLVRGSQLVIATSHHPTNWQKLIATHRVSILHLFPSELSLWLTSIRPDIELNSLRWVLCSGEPLPCNLHQTFYQHFAACGLHYFYSQPEAGGAVTSINGKTNGDENRQSAGYPIVGQTVYVLDRHLQPVPVGVKGEIYIGGNNLARGYLNNSLQTAQDFIPNPFSKKSGARLFKTGEIGRRLNNSCLEVIGYLHRTAWIKGFKVNLAQIEAALLEAAIVSDCVVLVRETTSDWQLVAYVVTTLPFMPEKLHSHLQGCLPAHMLPDAYVPLTRLPLTKAGEVDRQVLTREAVIDTNLIQQWETQLRAIPEIEQVAVVVGEHTESLPALHLADLLPSAKNTPTASTVQFNSTKAAISQSQPLPQQAIAPTLSSALKQAATSDKGLIYVQSDGFELVQTYQDLLAQAEQILTGLRKQGLQPQDRVIFQLDNSQDFLPAFWACILGGFVPVPVSVAPTYTQLNTNASKLLNIWQMLERPPILTHSNFTPQIQSLSSLFDIAPLPVITIEELRQNERDSSWHNSESNDLAVLLLTSGSTGMSKAVMLTHHNLLSMSAGTIAMNSFSDKDTSLNWMPLDHAGALVFLSLMPTHLRCWQMHVPTELILQNPLKWLDLIHHHRASISWAPNFAFTLICDRSAEICQGHWDLSSMRFLVNAGEPIVAKTARNFLKLLNRHGLPSNAIHPAFGMCETCSGITWSAGFSLESSSDDMSFVELGHPIPGAWLRIVDENQHVVNEGTIGHLQVKGDSVTSGYYQNPEANQKAFTDDGWFDTGDLAFLDQGRLTITGREKEVIIIRGQNYYSHEIEAVVEEVEGVKVSYTAACAVRTSDSNTDQLAIFFSANTEGAFVSSQMREIRAKLNLQTGLNPDYIIPVTADRIPKTSLGKIERSRLRRQFEEGEFNEQLKQLDIEIENTNTLPNWFFRKIWRRKQVSQFQSLPIQNQQTLVFVDTCGLAQSFCRKSGEIPVQVEAGTDFAQLSPHHYRINPNNPEHYLQLLKSLAEAQVQIQQILHLWTYEDSITEIANVETLEQLQEQGVCSLLFLVQALVKVLGSSVSVQLYVISNHTQQVFEQEAIAAYKAPILGLLKTIPQEITGIACRHIDFSEHQIEENASYLRQELRIHSNESEVTFRKGQRWTSRLERINLGQEIKQDFPFKPGGMYLISGGLGGIGVEIAKALIQRYSENPPRLLLLGRTVLPDQSTWSTYLQQDTRISQTLKAYQSLKEFGNNIIYQAIDVCDFVGVQQAVQQAESQWGCKLDGVIHLAGIPQERMLVEETCSSLMATLRPKMLGTWVLHRLIKNQPDSLFITFSSVNSFFGGATIGAYAAANSFVESFTKQESSHLHSYCLTWSMWDEIGMSAGYEMKGFSRVKGFFSIPLAAALHSFAIALHHNQKQIFIGLDGSNLSIRRYSETESHSLQRLKAYFTSKSKNVSLERIQQLMVSDRFGANSTCHFIQIQEFPLTETGAIDRDKLVGDDHPLGLTVSSELSEGYVMPRTETERIIAAIWQEKLQVESKVGIHDNFFELGGHSLRLVQIHSKLQEIFGQKLSIAQMFQYPTIYSLSKHLTIAESTGMENYQSSPSLVALQPSGSEPPFFCVHPVEGVVFPYYELARLLGEEQPFYGLQSVGIGDEAQPLTSIEEMADHYLKDLRSVQPEGPYRLGGWSFGALVAFEMALQLQQAGQKVDLLALMDTSPPFDRKISNSFQMSKLVVNFLLPYIWSYVYDYFYQWLVEENPLKTNNFVQKVAKKLFVLIQNVSQSKKASQSQILMKFRQPVTGRLLRVMIANIQAYNKYVPAIYAGKINLFRASEQLWGTHPDSSMGWSQLAQGGVEIHEIPGNHFNILKSPNVQVIAQKLKICLNQVHSQQTTQSSK